MWNNHGIYVTDKKIVNEPTYCQLFTFDEFVDNASWVLRVYFKTERKEVWDYTTSQNILRVILEDKICQNKDFYYLLTYPNRINFRSYTSLLIFQISPKTECNL